MPVEIHACKHNLSVVINCEFDIMTDVRHSHLTKFSMKFPATPIGAKQTIEKLLLLPINVVR